MLKRFEQGAPVPVSGPVETMMRLSSEKAVSLPVKLSNMIFEAMALAPM